MRIIDGSGTHTFPAEKTSDIDDYMDLSRDVSYVSIDKLGTSANIGTDKNLTVTFFQLTRTQVDELITIFKDSKESTNGNSSITKIDNIDEVLSGETFTELLAATNGFFIETKELVPKKSIESKDIKFWNARLKFRFDTVTNPTKP